MKNFARCFNSAHKMNVYTTKTETFYTSCSPELAVVSYGTCREEAENSLADIIRSRQAQEPPTPSVDRQSLVN